jgi:O-antigen/teichoic acid export membrane protein
MQRGALQGTLRFGRYAISTVTEGLLKVLTATAVLLAVWKAVDAAVLAVVVSAAAAVVVNRALLGFLPRTGGDLAPTPHPYRYSLTTLGCMVLLAALLSVDVLAAKRYLGAHDAGIYASASLCGKVVFFATSSLSLVAFPLLSSHHERGTDARGPLTKALALVAAASAVLVAVYAIAPRAVVVPLFGERFAAAAPYLVWMGAAFAFYAVAYLAAMFLLSQKRLAGITALAIGALAQLAGFYCFHESIHALVAVNAAVFAGTAAALLAMAFRRGAHAS